MDETNFKIFCKNYLIKLIYDDIVTAHANMCFSNITKTHCVY